MKPLRLSYHPKGLLANAKVVNISEDNVKKPFKRLEPAAAFGSGPTCRGLTWAAGKAT